LLSTLQSADIVLPTTDGREIRRAGPSAPTAEQNPYRVGSVSVFPNVEIYLQNVVQTSRRLELIPKVFSSFFRN